MLDLGGAMNHKSRAFYSTGANECGPKCICTICKREKDEKEEKSNTPEEYTQETYRNDSKEER